MKALPLLLLLSTLAAAAPAPAKNDTLVERVGSTGFLQLKVDSFKTLTPKQKELAYWLCQASIAIDPVIYDQRSRFGLRQKRLLEGLVAHPEGAAPALRKKVSDFAKLFWGNRGNHNDNTSQKILPGFTADELRAAALAALKKGAFPAVYELPAITTEADLDRELADLKPSLFDADFEPMITAKSPQGGKDILESSANNFYVGVSLADLKDFKEQYPLNSRLVKGPGGALTEEVYRAGTPDGSVPPGRYALYLKKANESLAKAAAVADEAQAGAIKALMRFYETGDPADWLAHGMAWVQNDAKVDFSQGFIETYLDARSAKGSMHGYVTVTDEKLNGLMLKLAENAQYFEDHAPWDDAYRKQGVKPPLAKAVEAVIETGDFGVTTVGENLPNEDEIHQKYGTKSFLFTGSSRELSHAAGTASLEEFAASEEEVLLGKKYYDEAEDLMTALHEIIGHGSGKLKVQGDAGIYLKEYASTLEEARADLMALWNVWDPRLKELKLVSDQESVARQMYYDAARAPLVQLRRIPKGDTIEEDHQRDRQLIVNYIKDKTGAIQYFDRDGKTYVLITDFVKMKAGVGMLLKELMRIKAEGDYAAIKDMVEKYAVHFDPKLRDEVAARYAKLGLPTYWAGVNPRLEATFAPDGAVSDVKMTYPRDATAQYLRYASLYTPGLVR